MAAGARVSAEAAAEPVSLVVCAAIGLAAPKDPRNRERLRIAILSAAGLMDLPTGCILGLPLRRRHEVRAAKYLHSLLPVPGEIATGEQIVVKATVKVCKDRRLWADGPALRFLQSWGFHKLRPMGF